MNTQLATPFIGFLVLGFPVMWLATTTLLSYRSGWFDLMKAYPDQGEPVSAQFPGQSGSLNGVSLRRILKLSVGPAGLRLGMLRLSGPFNRDVCVPWRVIAVTRTQRPLIGKIAPVAFGQPAIAVLTLPAEVADDLAGVLPDHWPEAGPFPIEADGQVGWRIFQQWMLQTVLAATFFPLWRPVCWGRMRHRHPILFPAVVLGAASILRYVRRRRVRQRPG